MRVQAEATQAATIGDLQQQCGALQATIAERDATIDSLRGDLEAAADKAAEDESAAEQLMTDLEQALGALVIFACVGACSHCAWLSWQATACGWSVCCRERSLCT